MAAQTHTLSAWNARRLPDENVFDGVLRGDPVAFSEVYRRYQKRIYGFCLARSLDRDTAADATQEVFMKLLRAEPGSIENPRAWLFTVARNVVIDTIRRRARTPEDSSIEEQSLAWDRLKSADTADEVLARSDARNVFLALRTMRPRYRTALIMREIHGQSAADMAESLETTTGAVDTLVSRARDAFGVAYASVGDLPAACRSTVELIYRRTGTGITPQAQTALDAHLKSCDRCRAEAKRAQDPKHLAALLPFLIPAGGLAKGALTRAAMTVRSFPEVVTPHAAAVLTQPHTWSLATKLAAGALAAVLVTAPIVATTTHRQMAPRAGSSASAVMPRTASSDGASGLGAMPYSQPMGVPSGSGGSGGMMTVTGSSSGSSGAITGTSPMPKRTQTSGGMRGAGSTSPAPSTPVMRPRAGTALTTGGSTMGGSAPIGGSTSIGSGPRTH